MNDTAEAGGCGTEPELAPGVRLVVLNLPEDEGEGLGFRLTRTLWDPYPWVREVTPNSRADAAGLKMGDCLLQTDGKDLLGLPVGQVAGLIRGDGAGRGVSLLVWNCGVDPKDDPELLWSCGGGVRGEKARRALSGVVRALACCVCGATVPTALHCRRSHLHCRACWLRLDRCALCREPLPAIDSPYAKNLVATQVFEAIAAEYELKDSTQKPRETVSAYSSPNRSPNLSPAVYRRVQYQAAMNRKKTVQFNELQTTYGSDPNIHRSSIDVVRKLPNSTNETNLPSGNTQLPEIRVQNAEEGCSSKCPNVIEHRLVSRLRQACSLADLQNPLQSCQVSQSLNSLEDCKAHVTSSLENLKNSSSCDGPVFLIQSPPIYVVTCDHKKESSDLH